MGTNQRIRDAKRMVGCLNSIWWDQYIANKTKKRLGRCLVESVMMYGSELWVENSSFPFPFVPLQRRGCLVAPLFL
jgi:hypothetical protein